ncbi:MAG: AI-2E family transporter [Anaerolineales bacterium]|nr:AI-2E family transporter [Anaerolineales bacterium]
MVLLLIGAAVLLQNIQIIIAPLVLAGILAFILNPIVNYFNRLARIPRSLTLALIYLAFILIISILIISLTPLLIRQIQNLMTELPQILQNMEQMLKRKFVLGPFELDLSGVTVKTEALLLDTIQSFGSESINFLGEVVSGVAEAGLILIFTFIVSFYLVKDGYKAIEWVYEVTPPEFRQDMRYLLSEINLIWGSFFRGQITLTLLVSVIIGIAGSIIGLPLALLMGVFAGLLELLPSLGHGIWFVTAILLALFSGSTWEWMPLSNFWFAVLVAGLHIIFQQIDLNIIIPRIIGSRVHLHPAIVIIGILIGASLGGVLGIFLAAPTIATVRVLGRYIHANLIDKDPFPVIEKEPPASLEEE